jgi:hypothetical protein
MPAPLSGSCLCGAIRYTISAPLGSPPAELRACHCTHCQKTSGAGGSVNLPTASDAFKITQGTPKRYAAKAASGRTLYRFFCADCGSPIYSQRETNPAMVTLRAGTLDNAGDMKITAHIWTKSKRPWSYIDPASQQLPGQPN